jgi:hypothetical protein
LFDRSGNSFLYSRIFDGEGYEVKGDCNICVNGKLPFDSATCVECGLSRKNYKSISHADRIRSMTDEELAEYHAEKCGCPHDPIVFGCRMATIGCIGCWLDWLKQEATDG